MARRVLIGAALGAAAVALLRRLRGDPGAEQPTPTSAAAPRHLPSRDELYREAQALDIPGRSQMTKAQLALAVRSRRGEVMSR